MPNYVIKHLGMGFPVGSVVPAALFPGNVQDHLAIGSIALTTNPVNVDLPESLSAAPAAVTSLDKGGDDGELYRLREELVLATGLRAEAANKITALVQDLEKAKSDLAEMTKDRDEWKALAEQKDANDLLQDPTKQKPLT